MLLDTHLHGIFFLEKVFVVAKNPTMVSPNLHYTFCMFMQLIFIFVVNEDDLETFDQTRLCSGS